MKIILEFEDKDEALIYINGMNYALAFSDLDDKLRAMTKYEDKETIPIDEARDLIRECMNDRNINLNILE